MLPPVPGRNKKSSRSRVKRAILTSTPGLVLAMPKSSDSRRDFRRDRQRRFCGAIASGPGSTPVPGVVHGVPAGHKHQSRSQQRQPITVNREDHRPDLSSVKGLFGRDAGQLTRDGYARQTSAVSEVISERCCRNFPRQAAPTTDPTRRVRVL